MSWLDKLLSRAVEAGQVSNRQENIQYEVVDSPIKQEPVVVKQRHTMYVKSPEAIQLEGYSKRAYKAAGANRTISDWSGSYLTANEETRGALTTLRALSRDLELNNNYMLKYLAAVVTNIVGAKGFTLQIQSKDSNGSLDTLANSLLEEGFYKWSKKGICELSGRYTFKELTRLIMRTVARDGECLVRKIRDKEVNKFGYSLQLLDIDRLATMHNKRLDNGNIISMGIEVDKYQRPIAYYIYKDLTQKSNMQYGEMERVVARDMFHIYRPNRAEQFRGIPWVHSVISTLEMLAGYLDASVTKKRIAASSMGFFTTKSGDASELGEEETDEGQFINYAEPGKFQVLPKDADFKPFDPQSNDDYDTFVKSLLRAISAALGISYHTLANDLENVNFSSIRAGVLEERDLWKTTQDWFISQFLEPVYEDWLLEALTNGALQYPGGKSLPIEKLEKFSDVTWTGRRWSWVSPTDEMDAAVKGVGEVLGTRTSILAEQGMDFDEVVLQLAQEEKKIRDAGITVTSFVAKAKETAINTSTKP